MKKNLAVFAVLCAMFSFNPANADVYKDVPADYWANKEITAVVKDGVLSLTKNYFNPETTVSRSDFNSALLKTLGYTSANADVNNPFSDVNAERADYADILLSSNIGLIYGYTDGTFKPDRIMTKAEAASVISHITKDFKGNTQVLNQFTDKNDVPAWAKAQFAKTVDLGIYVNYPNENELLPNKDLNRAEAAVLLHKLSQSLDSIKPEYISNKLGIEHLNVTKKADVNEVQINSDSKVVFAKNIIKGYFATEYTSKEAKIGDSVVFTAKKDIYTKEGTLVIPADTKMTAKVVNVEEKQIWNRNDKVTVEFETMTLPSGTVVPFKAEVLNNNGVLTENRWAKPLGYTAAGAVIGGGVGVGIAGMSCHDHYDHGVAIGIPVGAGLGLATGLATKGRTYNADECDYLWLELTRDLCIPNE